MNTLRVGAALGAALCVQDWREDVTPPARVAVRAVFVVPAGERAPSDAQRAALLRHLRIARDRYAVLLGGRVSFALDSMVETVALPMSLAALRRERESGAPAVVAALLDQFRVSRFANPWIFVAVVMNPADDFPVGGGRPINGGLNAGGGIVVLSSFALDRIPNVQSTLQHELGHAFGLVHVDVYGGDMQRDASLMSYNRAHHTAGFTPSETPGGLGDRDRRALANNRRVFPLSGGDTSTAGLVPLGPMEIPGHVDAVPSARTSFGALHGSSAGHVTRGLIAASAGPGITFDGSRMWHSDSSATGWVALDLEFPVPVELSRIVVHSGHSGRYHPARRARVTLGDRVLAEAALDGSDASIAFAPARGRHWRLELQGASGFVVVRGLRFFGGATELFPR